MLLKCYNSLHDRSAGIRVGPDLSFSYQQWRRALRRLCPYKDCCRGRTDLVPAWLMYWYDSKQQLFFAPFKLPSVHVSPYRFTRQPNSTQTAEFDDD